MSGAVLAGFYVWQFYNFRLLVQETTNGNATAVFVGADGNLFENGGTIYALAKGNAAGVEHWGPDILVRNTGLIAAFAPAPSDRPGGGGGNDVLTGGAGADRLTGDGGADRVTAPARTGSSI